MKTQQKFSEYLRFSQKDRIAILIIAAVMLAGFLLPSFLHEAAPGLQPSADTAWISALQKLETPTSNTARTRDRRKSEEEYSFDQAADRYNNGQEAELFTFDPNTLDVSGWKRLGVQERTIGTIRKFLDKGGRFKNAGDLRKIYGLQPGEADRLQPYVMIVSTGKGPRSSAIFSPVLPVSGNTDERALFRSRRAIAPVDINTGDSLAFENLPGIGPTLASRIIRFREKLGGFYDIDQVSETFGISDSAFGIIKPYLQINKEHLLQKIPINTIDLNGLRKHPYIKYQIAAAIINYRTQHGLFNSAEDLKRVAAIDPLLLKKITPYLSFTQ